MDRSRTALALTVIDPSIKMSPPSSPVQLIGAWASSFALRPQVALNLKGVEYEFLEGLSLESGKSELLLKSNPVHKKVPVLLHGGRPVCESLVIVQYIDEVWADSGAAAILPADPHRRAIQRFWAAYVDDKFMSALYGVYREPTAEKAEPAAAALAVLEGAFRECSEGGPFFGGEKLGFVDIALGSQLAFTAAVEEMTGLKVLDKAKLPQLAAWAERFRAHDAVKDVIPDHHKLVEFFKTAQAKMRNAAAQ